MSASGSPIDVTNAIEQAPFGRFQLIVTALCAWIALLDGFDPRPSPMSRRSSPSSGR